MAEHAKNNVDTNMTAERVKAIVLLIVQLYSVVQTGLTLGGFNALPFATDDVSAAITGVIAVVSSVYAWWRNNNMTAAAMTGQQLTDSIKTGRITLTQGTNPAPEVAAVVSDTTAAEDVVLDTVTGTPVIEVG